MSKDLFSIRTINEPHMELVLTHTHVLLRLSDEALDEIQQQLKEEEGKEEPFHWVQSLKSFILNSVDRLIHKSIEYPIHDIQSLIYEDNKLVFEYAREHFLKFDSISIHGSKGSVLENFDPEEAQLFCKKFETAKERYTRFVEGSDEVENLPG